MWKNLTRSVKFLKLTVDIIKKRWSKGKIFVNERLTKSKKALFTQARAAKKNKKYKYVWISNADILVRKNESSKITKIKSSQDIENL